MMKSAALTMIRLYQRFVSPLLGPACRYTPTCSHYAAEAIDLHGARGVLLAGWRLLRCHPFARGGFDPVPLPKTTFPSAQKPNFSPAGTRAGSPGWSPGSLANQFHRVPSGTTRLRLKSN